MTFWPSSPGALQIESSEESDQGKYECVAVNSAGTRYSAPANLYVRGKISLDHDDLASLNSSLCLQQQSPLSSPLLIVELGPWIQLPSKLNLSGLCS